MISMNDVRRGGWLCSESKFVVTGDIVIFSPENNALSCKIGEDVLDVYTRLMQTSFFTVNSF